MKSALSELRTLRENNRRDSAKVVSLWYSDIKPRINSLSVEKWTILEQVLIAALDTADFELAETCLLHLKNRFPESCRVKRLEGMLLEATNKIEGARAIYKEILEKDTTDIVARKRMIATYKSQGLINHAIEELNKYLKTFMADGEAWSELGDLYLSQGDYKHAAFCVEEMILANPHNHLLHERLAEIKYSEGGVENLEVARAYFAHACRLNPTNVRALYGLVLTASSLCGKITEKSLLAITEGEGASSSRNGGQYSLPPPPSSSPTQPLQRGTANADSKRDNHQLIGWAVAKLKKIYAEARVGAPITLVGALKSKHAVTGPGKNKGDSTIANALPDMFERLSTTGSAENSPRMPKKPLN